MDYKEFLKQIVKECNSKADLCRALDKKPIGGNYATIDKIIKNYNLDISHFKNEPWNKGVKYDCKRYTLDEILSSGRLTVRTQHFQCWNGISIILPMTNPTFGMVVKNCNVISYLFT